LPSYRYTGPIRFAPISGISKDYLPDDPFFLLGNYRLTLFVHASGMFQILSGERAWGRLNQGPATWSGANDAAVETGGRKTILTGPDAPEAKSAEKVFGIGYAQYRYRLGDGLRVTRTISVLPSPKPGEGTSGFLLSVNLRNGGGKPLDLAHTERVGARYAQLFATWDADQSLVHYDASVTKDAALVRSDFHATEPKPLLFSHGGRMARFEGAPPSLYVRLVPAVAGIKAMHTSNVDENGMKWLGVRAECTLEPGQEKTLHCLIGYAFRNADIANAADKLTAAMSDGYGPHFRAQWNRAIPPIADEKDPELRREMRWNIGVLEQMATWREYYDETVVPQGTVYDYEWGNMASSRDLAQHALPLCHINPAVARSVLRYIMKRTIPDGEIKLDDLGFGWAPATGRMTSDQQLYFFLLLNEYLRDTKDRSILTESVSYYPREAAGEGSGLDHVRDAFLFLRDRIGTGPHGLMKLWNSDWNDMFYFWPTSQPYNYIFESSESHMNTAMAIVILADLAQTLRTYGGSPEAAELSSAVSDHRAQLLQAFLKDWGDAPFPKRMYFENRAVGEHDMWLEPQGFALQIAEIPEQRKRALFAELRTRLMKGEAMGPKQMEKPLQRPGTPPGTREDGGFWYALTGPVVLGVAGFDRDAAETMMRQMTFANYRRHFPEYWTGQWAASDSLDSASLPSQGLSLFLPYCAHAHAWPLYCYLRLKEGSGIGVQESGD
jgi:cellobiose phosphorylase